MFYSHNMLEALLPVIDMMLYMHKVARKAIILQFNYCYLL